MDHQTFQVSLEVPLQIHRQPNQAMLVSRRFQEKESLLEEVENLERLLYMSLNKIVEQGAKTNSSTLIIYVHTYQFIIVYP